MQFNPYLVFNGTCAEAFRFYEKVLRGHIDTMSTHGETEARDHVPANWQDKIMHVQMTVGDTILMGSDAPPDHYRTPQGFSVSIQVNDADEADRVFAALAEGGEVRMPIQKTFWAQRFGMLTDRFGIPWMVNCTGAIAVAASGTT